MLPFKTKPIYGLDLSADAVRILRLKNESYGVSIVKTADVALSAGAIIEGKIQQPELVLDAINQLVTAASLKNASVGIAMPGNTVVSRRIKIPSVLKEQEYESEIHSRIDYYLPGTNEKFYFDYFLQGPSELNHQNVLLIAARQEQVNQYVSLVNEANLKVKFVDVDSYAFSRGVKYFLPETEGTVAALEIQKTSAFLAVYKGDVVILNQRFYFSDTVDLISHLYRSLKLCFSNYHDTEVKYYLIDKNPEVSEILLKEFTMEKLSVLDSAMMIEFGLALRGLSEC